MMDSISELIWNSNSEKTKPVPDFRNRDFPFDILKLDLNPKINKWTPLSIIKRINEKAFYIFGDLEIHFQFIIKLTENRDALKTATFTKHIHILKTINRYDQSALIWLIIFAPSISIKIIYIRSYFTYWEKHLKIFWKWKKNLSDEWNCWYCFRCKR